MMSDKRLGVKKSSVRPSLIGRRARCVKCGKITRSDWSLDFFTYQAGQKFDEYYCGCQDKKEEWYDDAKAGGTSLALGSEEYEEFVRDQFENSTEKPDDINHVILEQNNVRDPNAESREDKQKYEKTETARRGYRNREFKETQMTNIRKRAMNAASLTDTKKDDKRARALPKGAEKALYDEGITADEYDEVLIHTAIGKYMT